MFAIPQEKYPPQRFPRNIRRLCNGIIPFIQFSRVRVSEKTHPKMLGPAVGQIGLFVFNLRFVICGFVTKERCIRTYSAKLYRREPNYLPLLPGVFFASNSVEVVASTERTYGAFLFSIFLKRVRCASPYHSLSPSSLFRFNTTNITMYQSNLFLFIQKWKRQKNGFFYR